MQFNLNGTAWWSYSHDDDRRQSINEDFEAETLEAAAEEAEKRLKVLRQQHAHHDFGAQAQLRVITHACKITFRNAKPAIPAVEAKPAVEAGFVVEMLTA